MGFGSGGGGFTPSPNNVPGSTETGTLLTDTHEFTGSVDITGSLLINGVQITQNGGGGGGGSPGGANTQVQFNDNGSFGGSANFTFDGNTITVSDDADVAAKIGRANIGAVAGGTSDYAYFSHRDQASVNNYALQQRADGTTLVNAPAGGDISFRIGNVSTAMVINGGENNNIGINNGTPEARLHVSANTNEKDVLRADGDINNILYVSGSGRVGIGTGTPESTLEVRSTTTQQKWSYDDDHEFTITVADDGETVLAVSGTTVSPSPASDLVFDVSRGGDIFFRRSGDRLRLGISTGTTFLQTDNQNTDMSFRVHPNGGLGAVGTEVFRVDASGAGALLVSGTISNPGGDAPINFRDTATSIHSPGSNRLAITAPTLEVSGTLRVSGTYGSTTVETLTANGAISATTGLTIIDASSSLAVNNTLSMTIANGTFIGQEKKIRGMIVSGSTGGATSTGISIGGANIDSPPTSPAGQITLSASIPGSGPLFSRAGCTLVWGGTKWLPVGNFNFNINNTGRLF